MIDTSKPTGHRLGYLLLRDGHAIPLHGISPDEIKEGAKRSFRNPEADPLPHRNTLNAIVNCLGFSGDFGTFMSTGWPHFQRFLTAQRCTDPAGVFPADHGGCIDLHFAKHSEASPRHLADRIFESSLPTPKRVFLGYGVNWSAWDNGNGFDVPRDAITSIKGDQKQAIHLANDLFARRHDLMGQWGFIDDKLVYGRLHTIVDKTYWVAGSDPHEREEHHAKTVAAVRAFRAVFEPQPEGWVEVLPYNEKLVVLRAHDGCWSLLWRNYRDVAPPESNDIANSYVISIEDMPSRLMSKSDLRRAFHIRQKAWEEDEAHRAEQAFYDRGGSIRDRQLASSIDVRIAWLKEQGQWRTSERVVWHGPLPAGFHAAVVDGRKIAISDLIDVATFSQMLRETGYGERRADDREPWIRANDGIPGDAPVGASWVDAQAFCAWRERQLGVNLRLPSAKELRAIRPAYSKHYESMAFGDFPWEHFPPRPPVSENVQSRPKELPSAVTWSEPRFVEPGPDVPEFPPTGGWGSASRKRWIEDFPPLANWKTPIPWAEYDGLTFIDAWDAYEWCQEAGLVSGRFWEGEIGSTSWGAYKNMKVTFRVVMDIEV